MVSDDIYVGHLQCELVHAWSQLEAELTGRRHQHPGYAVQHQVLRTRVAAPATPQMSQSEVIV
jgi:hypothetical protein